MTNLYELLAAARLEDEIIRNRNTPPPPLPDTNPWLATCELIMNLGNDPMPQDDLYSIDVELQMYNFDK